VGSKPPVLKPREVIALLERLGFAEARQRGSHKQFRHPDGRSTTVPFHGGRDIAPTLLRQIARDVGLTVEELLAAR
jgi:predicted RNA binding protein YcfA (HicA-like mRNA interferase family)